MKNLIKKLLNKIFKRSILGGPIDPKDFVKKQWGNTPDFGFINTDSDYICIGQYTDDGDPSTPETKSTITFDTTNLALRYKTGEADGAAALMDTTTAPDPLCLATVQYVNAQSGGGGGGGSFELDGGKTIETLYTPWKFSAVTEDKIYYRIPTGYNVALTEGTNTISLFTTVAPVEFILHNSGSYKLTTDGYLYTLNTMNGYVYYNNSDMTFYLQIYTDIADTCTYRVFLVYQRPETI